MSVQAVNLALAELAFAEDVLRSKPTRARALPACPICNDTFVAAEASALRGDLYIQHLWTCEACGCGFVTEGKVVCH